MYSFFNLKENSSSNRFFRNFIIPAAALLVASAIPSVLGGQALATELSLNWAQPHVAWHKKNMKKISFATGTSAIYGHSNMFPKTDHFYRPIIKANVIVGNGQLVCTPSGLGHRATRAPRSS